MYFEQLDNERYAREEKLYKHFKWPQKSEGKFFNYRLMQPDEVPSWVQNDVSTSLLLQSYNSYCRS